MDQRQNFDVLFETVAVEGRRVVDVGCGDGSLLRAMAAKGAQVTGLETSPAQRERALAGGVPDGCVLLDAVGEVMPLPDAAFDLVVFFNSLHHVPAGHHDRALAEAVRVLVPGGLVYVAEPLAQGTFFELVRAVEDETEVRAQALEAIGRAGALGLVQEREIFYEHTVRLGDFAAFQARIGAFDEARKARAAAMEAELRAAYLRLARPGPEGSSLFSQPARVNLLRKQGASR